MKNYVLKDMALESLKGKWGLAIGGYFIFIVISIILSLFGLIGSIISILTTGTLILGISIFTLSISRNQEAKVSQIFDGFNDFGKSLATYLLMVLFVILWTLLLVIPGIIAAISYSMTFFILADNPSMRAMDAIDTSKKMMYGYKWKYFLLQLSFIGWALLCALTFGIGFLWLMPYIQISMAKFYDDIKGGQVATENVAPVETVPQAEAVVNPVVA